MKKRYVIQNIVTGNYFKVEEESEVWTNSIFHATIYSEIESAQDEIKQFEIFPDELEDVPAFLEIKEFYIICK